MNQEKEAIAKAPSGRVQRTPIGTRNILTVKGKDPNYVYRYVNDVDDRVSQFQAAGYELVEDNEVQVGDKRINSATSLGSKKHVSVGQGTKAYVMRIKREWYEEDQAAKLGRVAELERATKEKALDGAYGELKLSRD
jgi:hypothetical protein